MADPLVPPVQESKLNALNKKIVEIKKKIQLSEGQRKATFEECDAKKRRNAERIADLRRSVKESQVEFARARDNDEAAESAAQKSRESSAYAKKRSLEDAITKVDEDNVGLRKKLDLVRYRSDKQQKKLTCLLREYEDLVKGKVRKVVEKKLENPMKKKIIGLENHLQRMSVMQMEADTVRKKYRCVRSSLKADAAFYASVLQNLEENIQEQENEIARLQKVKEEAIELRDVTRENLTKQEVQAMSTSRERECVILDYRQRVESRKVELERLERMIFTAARSPPRDDPEGATGPAAAAAAAAAVPDASEKESASRVDTEGLEEAFAKLRAATGVIRTEDVLNRFLGQRATKDRLQKMRLATEEEKMSLEKKRQQLTNEIEMQKFSESKDADQNAEELDRLNRLTAEQRDRRENADAETRRLRELLTEVTRILWRFCDKLRDASPTAVPEDAEVVEDPEVLLGLLDEEIKCVIEELGGSEKYAELFEEPLTDKLETMSIATSGGGKLIHDEDRSLFPRFPAAPTPAAQPPPSEDEEEVPTRNLLKRQAQILFDTRSRRKGFTFRR